MKNSENRDQQEQKPPSILDQWLSQKGKKKGTSIGKLPEGEKPVLSKGQRRLWFLQSLYPENPFYHFVESLRFRGPLDKELFVKAFRIVTDRHENFRTLFKEKEGTPIQILTEQTLIEINEYQFDEIDEGAREARAKKMAVEMARKPFDLSTGPLIRLGVFKLSLEDHLVIIAFHHIIIDEWSIRILKREVASVYKSLVNHMPVQLTPIAVHYRDFAFWESRQPEINESLSYWQKKLANSPSTLNLPTNFRRPDPPTFAGNYITRELPLKLSQQLQTISKEASTTVFVTLLSAFKVLLFRYSNQEDILIGSPFTNRDKKEFEKIVGFFNNTVVLRSKLSNETPFLDLVEQVKQTVMEAFSHKNVPFDLLVNKVRPERVKNANPLFQSMFLYNKAAAEPEFGQGISLEHTAFDFGVSKFDLTLYIHDGIDKFSALIEYSKDLFEASTIHRILAHWEVLLSNIVKNPQQKIGQIPILPESELNFVLNRWNSSNYPTPNISHIHHLIEEKARKNPNQKAVVYQDEFITYQELINKANSLAAALNSILKTQGQGIGLFVDRSLDLIIGILGILKSGNAYVPLDPEYPQERIKFIIKDSKIPVLLTQSKWAPRLEGLAPQIITFEDTGYSENPVIEMPDKTQPAYTIYTSGSTGRPKGVTISNENLVYSTLARFQYYSQAPECFLLLSSFAFDSSVVGIFWTLCSGGTLVLTEKKIEQDISRLAHLFHKNKVTHTLLLPSLYRVLLKHAPPKVLNSLKTVIVAGRSLPFSPTEGTLHSTSGS